MHISDFRIRGNIHTKDMNLPIANLYGEYDKSVNPAIQSAPLLHFFHNQAPPHSHFSHKIILEREVSQQIGYSAYKSYQ